MIRPWYTLYAIVPDRERPVFLICGFTPPPGTTPAQAAALRFWGDGPAPLDRRVLYADDRAALYDEPAGSILEQPRTQRLIVRYDDLMPPGQAVPWFPGEAVHQLAADWVAPYRRRA